MSSNNWRKRVPLSLRLPWRLANDLLDLASLLAEFQELEQIESPYSASPYSASDVKFLFGKFTVESIGYARDLRQALMVVGDEFAAAADSVEEFGGWCASSVHELVFDYGYRFTLAIENAIVPLAYPDYLDDLRSRDTTTIRLTENDIAKHFQDAKRVALELPVLSEAVGGRLLAKLEQELCRAVDRRLVTKRSYPEDEEDETIETMVPWDAKTEARNKWVYETASQGTPYPILILELKKCQDWEPLYSTPGLKKAGNAYARYKGLPPIPRRRPGRPQKN